MIHPQTNVTQIKSSSHTISIDVLADAILRFLNWQSRQLEMRQQRKIKAMVSRLRNRKARCTD